MGDFQIEILPKTIENIRDGIKNEKVLYFLCYTSIFGSGYLNSVRVTDISLGDIKRYLEEGRTILIEVKNGE